MTSQAQEEDSFVKYQVRSSFGAKQTFKVAHGGYCYSRDKIQKDTHYYYCDNKSCKASIVWRNGRWSYGKKYWNADGTHSAHLPDKDKREREVALDKLNKLTLSADGCRKGIDIVRQVLKEAPPRILSQMPSVIALVQRVRRFAAKNNIKLLKSRPEDFIDEETTTAAVSSTEVVKTGIVITNPVSSNILEDEQLASLVFLQEHENEHCMARLEGHEFTWRQTLNRGEKFLYSCREAKGGCPANVVIDSVNNKYELRGIHAHHGDRITGQKRKQGSAKPKILKRVDEFGNKIGAASLDDFFSGAAAANNWEVEDNCKGDQIQSNSDIQPPKLVKISSEQGNNEILEDYHHGDDGNYQMNDDAEEQEKVLGGDGESRLFNQISSSKSLSRIITTSSVLSRKKLQAKINCYKKARKSGERCFVCGDQLMVSETLSSSSETFKKACCYLNVKSEMNWFPLSSSSKFYSFCESCTDEITKIHGLYRKVEEIQSLIFRKVESVEKRIADAEIVDNWMAEAPKITAVRFEGFRKQVMINYRNKLKLRREIRYGNKAGHPLVEATPGISAHMLASDPLDFQNEKPGICHPNDTVISSNHTTFTSPRRKTTGRPKSKKAPKEEILSTSELVPEVPMFFDSPFAHPNDVEQGFHNDFDDSQDDAISVASDKETKFWENDPSKLHIGRDEARKRKITNYKHENDDYEEEEGCMRRESDPSYNEEENEEWGAKKNTSKSRPSAKRVTATDPGAINKGRGIPRRIDPSSSQVVASEPSDISNQKAKKVERQVKSRSARTLVSNKVVEAPRKKEAIIQFPDCVLTKDGRLFMEGVEIIKNPPGTYKPRPLQPSFSCGSCCKIACGFYTIRIHICGHHLAMFKCPICQRECADPRAVRHHMASVHEEAKLEECPICGKPIKVGRNKTHMGFHQWQHLSAEEKNDPQYSRWKPPKERVPTSTAALHKQSFMCGQCARTFSNPAFLKRHEFLQHADPGSHMCQYCGKICSGRRTLSRHVRECANKSNGIVTTRKRYPCPKCPTQFTLKKSVVKHLRKSHGVITTPSADLTFACPKCPRRFSNRAGFRSHKKVCVDGEKGFSYNSNNNKKSFSDPQPTTSGAPAGAPHYSQDLKVDPSEGSLSVIQSSGFGSSAVGFNSIFLGN